MIFLQTLDEIAWRTGTKPVGTNLLTSQCSYKTERIKHILRILTEMVAIIILTLQRYGIFPTHSALSQRYEESKEVLLLAYDLQPGSRKIVYSLCELSIKLEETVQAVEYYKEFIQIIS